MPDKYERGSAFSISSIETFYQCPAKGYLSIIANVQPQRSMPAAERGTAIHAFLADYVKHYPEVPWSTQKERFLDSYQGFDREEVNEILEGIEEIYGPRPDVKILPDGVTDFFTEHELTFRRDCSPIQRRGKNTTPAFGCKLDLLYFHGIERRSVVITDYKTDRRPPYREVIERDPQMRTYAWAVCRHYPSVQEIGLKKSYLRYEWSKNVPIVYFPREEFANVWNELAGKVKPIIEAQAAVANGMDPLEAFPPSPTEYPECLEFYAEKCEERRNERLSIISL